MVARLDKGQRAVAGVLFGRLINWKQLPFVYVSPVRMREIAT